MLTKHEQTEAEAIEEQVAEDEPEYVWVWEGRLTKADFPYVDLVKRLKSELPDGVGFKTRWEAKEFAKRKVNAKPVWLD